MDPALPCCVASYAVMVEKQQCLEVPASRAGCLVAVEVDLRKEGSCICWPGDCLTASLFPSVGKHIFSV